MIPVVSMRLRFGKAEEPDCAERTCIIEVDAGEKGIGLVVDAVQETIMIDPEHIAPPPTTGNDRPSPYTMGIAQLHGNQNTVLIHVQKLFGQ